MSVGLERVLKQLHGHVEFLARLAETPELQSLFLISERDGSTYLPETTKHLILEQAARTSKFLSELGEGSSVIGDIEEQLGLKFNATHRLSDLRRFIQGQVADQRELAEMLWQEIVICEVLRRFVQNLSAKRESVDRAQELRRRASDDTNELELEIQRLRKELQRRGSVDEEAIRAQFEREFEQKKKELKRKLTLQIREEEREAADDVQSKLAEKIRRELRAKIEAEVRESLRDEIEDEVRREFTEKVEPQLRRDIAKQTAKMLRGSIRDEVEDDLRSQIEADTRAKVERELRPSLTREIRASLREEMRPKIVKEVEAELKPRVKAEVTE